jgi:hypothetical protein
VVRDLRSIKNQKQARSPAPGWVIGVRWVLRVGLWIVLAGVLVQSYLAGRALFGAESFRPHVDLGYPLAHMLAPILLVVSFFARLSLKMHAAVAIVFLLVALQPSLAAMRTSLVDAAALHPLNAVVVFAMGLWVNRMLRSDSENAIRECHLGRHYGRYAGVWNARTLLQWSAGRS